METVGRNGYASPRKAGHPSRLSRPRKRSAARPSGRPDGLAHIIGESPAFLAQLNAIPRAAASDATVLISGETGTGKDVWAAAIHSLSARHRMPFVAVNCTIASHLLENELFGHERGAYTGANHAAPGKVEHAEGGTLFLDEINAMPLEHQVKLLQVLEHKICYRLGSHTARTANVRIIAASNSDLRRAIAEGRFREDLFHRLSVLLFDLPPLRDRAGDVGLLARHFVRQDAAACKSPARALSPAALRKLEAHDWSGNVRELRNAIQRALHETRSRTVQAGQITLPPPVVPSLGEPLTVASARVKAEFEARTMRSLLLATHGNVTRAAQLAFITRRNFQLLLRKHQITLVSGAWAFGLLA